MLPQEVGLIFTGTFCCVIVNALMFAIYTKRGHPIIQQCVPTLMILEGFIFQSLIAYTTQQTVQNSTQCFVYLWLPLVSANALAFVKLMQCSKWFILYNNSMYMFLKENGYDGGANGQTQSKKSINDKTRTWVYRKFNNVTNTMLVKAFAIGVAFSLILPAVLNIAIPRYRESIGGYCKDRTNAESILISVEMVLLIIPDITAMVFFFRKNVAHSIKRMMWTYIFGWILMLIINSLLPRIGDKWIYKYGDVVGLLVPYLLENLVVLFSAVAADRRTDRRNSSSSVMFYDSDKKINFRSILSFKSSKGAKIGKTAVCQFINNQRFAADAPDKVEIPEFVDYIIMCVTKMYEADFNNNDAVLSTLMFAYAKHFMGESDPKLKHMSYLYCSDFPIDLDNDVKQDLLRVVAKGEATSWSSESVQMDEVRVCFLAIQDYMEQILKLYIDENFLRSDEYRDFVIAALKDTNENSKLELNQIEV